MLDNYTIVIWSKNYKDSFEMQVDRVYQSLAIMNNIKNLEPKYLTAKSKNEASEFILSRENVQQIINKKTNKKNSSLGATIGFFTSKDDTKICGITISTGIKSSMFVNSIVLNLNHMNLCNDPKKREQIVNLFKELIVINDAFYGCITDYENKKLYDSYYDNKYSLPKNTYWLNYWGEDIIKQFSSKNIDIENIKDKVYRLEKNNNGYFIQLTETSIFNDQEKQILQKKINQQLKL